MSDHDFDHTILTEEQKWAVLEICRTTAVDLATMLALPNPGDFGIDVMLSMADVVRPS